MLTPGTAVGTDTPGAHPPELSHVILFLAMVCTNAYS